MTTTVGSDSLQLLRFYHCFVAGLLLLYAAAGRRQTSQCNPF